MSDYIASEEQSQKARSSAIHARLMGGVKRESSQRAKVVEIKRKMEAIVAKPMPKRKRLFSFQQPMDQAIPALLWRQIMDEVAAAHGMRVNEMLARNRTMRVVLARQECWHRLRTETRMSLPEIGRKTGGFDHSSVLNGLRKHAQRIRDGRAV